jgi:hypothetical protein
MRTGIRAKKHTHTMKGQNKSLIWTLSALFALAFAMPLNAQDDLYYDPATDSKPVPVYEDNYEESNNVTRRYDGDDDQYYEEDDYAYEYSSRIRRFHRPAAGIDYYDPLFVDLYYYDPFFMPGASIYTYGYNDYWRWRRWQRWNRWNAWNSPFFGPSWGVGYSPWGWNVNMGWGGYNAWNNPYVWNNYYYDPYWTWNGFNPYYGGACVPGFHNYYYFYNNNGGGFNNGGYQPQTYVGPRRGGTSVGSGNYARLTNGNSGNGRLVSVDDGKKAPVIDMQARPSGRTNVGKDATTPSSSNVNRKPTTTTAKDPATVNGRRDQEVGTARPSTETRPSRETAKPNEATPSRRPSQEPTQTRPSRNEETRPSRNQETRPSRQSGSETRPSRSSGSSDQGARPSRPSSQDRPSRSIESRPSRSNDSGSGKSWDSGSSRSSGSSGSSGGSRSGGSSGGGSKSSGGGSRGRN